MTATKTFEFDGEIEVVGGKPFVASGSINIDDEPHAIIFTLRISALGEVTMKRTSDSMIRWEMDLVASGRFALCVLGKVAPSSIPTIEECWSRTFGSNSNDSIVDKGKEFLTCCDRNKHRIFDNLAEVIAECIATEL